MDTLMQVLRPQLLDLGECNFRINPCKEAPTQKHYEDDFIDDDSDCYEEDEVCDADVDVRKTAEGYEIVMTEVPSALIGFVKGKGSNTQKRLEFETETKIDFKRVNPKENRITIFGKNRSKVMSAHTRLTMLLDTARSKQSFTHFLCIPVHSEQFQNKFCKFKELVMEECGEDYGIDSSIFQNPSKLHMTLGMLVLLTEKEVEHAAQLLLECGRNIKDNLSNNAFQIAFRGLEYMNDDPGNVDVLYVKAKSVQQPDILQQIADDIVNRFEAEGLLVKEHEHVKIHMTAMNSIYRKTSSQQSRGNQYHQRPKRQPFNARNVLANFGDYGFGVESIRELHISELGPTGRYGFYKCAGQIPLHR